jgi:MYXO-CTERM domain-containing protein
VPDNFFEIKVNEARIDWLGGGRNYDALVRQAADEAGGNAFVTDYAGPTEMLRGALYQPQRFNLDSVGRAASPPDALDQVGFMGFPRDGQLLAILRRHIPVPQALASMGVDERAFYNNLRGYWQTHREHFKPFDAAAFAAELDKDIVQPLARAQEMLTAYPTLTRLTTFISPEEMNVDPTFVMNPSLPAVPVERKADAYLMCGDRAFTRCTAPVRVDLPSGGELWLKPASHDNCRSWSGRAPAYDRADVDQLPALERGWQREALGDGALKFDNDARIAAGLTRQKAQVERYVAAVGGGALSPDDASAEAGCACATPGGGRGTRGALGVAALVGLALALRRRRRRV